MPKYKNIRKETTTEIEIAEMIKEARWNWLKALIAFLYLVGCRITEALNLKRRNLWVDGNYLIAQIGVLKKKETQKGPYDITPHLIHINVNAPFVKTIILPYLETITDREERLFPYTRQLAWYRMKQLDPFISPHVFRHDRLMKLALKGGTEAQLTDWAGWADSRPASYYIRATGRLAAELADKVE